MAENEEKETLSFGTKEELFSFLADISQRIEGLEVQASADEETEEETEVEVEVEEPTQEEIDEIDAFLSEE